MDVLANKPIAQKSVEVILKADFPPIQSIIFLSHCQKVKHPTKGKMLSNGVPT
jgi:hypothetical protein